MKKKLISLLAAAGILAASMPVSAIAAESDNSAYAGGGSFVTVGGIPLDRDASDFILTFDDKTYMDLQQWLEDHPENFFDIDSIDPNMDIEDILGEIIGGESEDITAEYKGDDLGFFAEYIADLDYEVYYNEEKGSFFLELPSSDSFTASFIDKDSMDSAVNLINELFPDWSISVDGTTIAVNAGTVGLGSYEKDFADLAREFKKLGDCISMDCKFIENAEEYLNMDMKELVYTVSGGALTIEDEGLKVVYPQENIDRISDALKKFADEVGLDCDIEVVYGGKSDDDGCYIVLRPKDGIDLEKEFQIMKMMKSELSEDPFVMGEPDVCMGGVSFIDMMNGTDGDANCDDMLTIADATAILQAIGNPDKYGLSRQGKYNADIYEPGSGVTGMDAVQIMEIKTSK